MCIILWILITSTVTHAHGCQYSHSLTHYLPVTAGETHTGLNETISWALNSTGEPIVTSGSKKTKKKNNTNTTMFPTLVSSHKLTSDGSAHSMELQHAFVNQGETSQEKVGGEESS